MSAAEIALQGIADNYLKSCFDGMPSIPVAVSSEFEFVGLKTGIQYLPDRNTILVSPNWVSNAPLVESIIKRELVHAWMYWKGFHTKSTINEDVDGYNEYFLWKAQQLDIDLTEIFQTYPVTKRVWEKIEQGWNPFQSNVVIDVPILTHSTLLGGSVMNETDLVLQGAADRLLSFYDNMPSVPILVGTQEDCDRQNCLAYYSENKKTIFVSPVWVYDVGKFGEIQNTVKHELVHAWLHWKGLDSDFIEGKDVGGHNEYFLWKAHQLKIEITGTLDKYPATKPVWEKIQNGWSPFSSTVIAPVRSLPSLPRIDTPPPVFNYRPIITTTLDDSRPNRWFDDLFQKLLFCGMMLVLGVGIILLCTLFTNWMDGDFERITDVSSGNFQKIADSYLSKFDNMPSVKIQVRSNKEFQVNQVQYVKKGVGSKPTIYICKEYVESTGKERVIEAVQCALIFAWLDRQGKPVGRTDEFWEKAKQLILYHTITQT